MKTLLFMRHAKSSWDNASLGDHDRPLNQRGLADAPRMGRLLRELDLVPDHIISSTAVRAADTAGSMAIAAGFEGDIVYDRRLYHADPETYLELAQALDDAIVSVLLVGHNPGIEMLVGELSDVPEHMPTAALAVFDVDIASWRELDEDAPMTLRGLWVPKAIG